MNFENLLSGYKSKTCILSVEKLSDGSYGNIRIVAGNKAHCEEMFQVIHRPFIPDSPYEEYFPQNKNFEDYCIRCAIEGQPLHTYVDLPQMGLWLNMILLPLESDKENIGYCLYSYEVTPDADCEQRASLSADTASLVLQTCIKLRGSANIPETFQEVIEDVRQICDSDRCCILLTDSETHRCTVLCEAIKPGSSIPEFAAYLDNDFYNITQTWNTTIGDSTCVIIKNQQDMDWLGTVNPLWRQSLIERNISSIAMFPLKYKRNGETLGYMWASNFDTGNTVKIKETLELTTFFFASELANFQLLKRLETLSSIDLLTGVKNRNTMNNAMNLITSGRKTVQSPCAVIFADLNGLKRMNDEKGHIAGDQILKTAAAILRSVFYDCELYRAGGDEFMILSEGKDENELNIRIQMLQKRAETTPDVHFAIGMCVVTEGQDIRKAMQIADDRMYLNKKAFYEAHPEFSYR